MDLPTTIAEFDSSRLKGKGASVTIGNFDGCHTGHLELIRKCNSYRGDDQLKSIAVTFTPHPQQFFTNLPAKKLFLDQHKSDCLKELGIDIVLFQKFNHEFSILTHEEFLDILANKLKAKSITIGHDFRFGQDRKGTAEWLKIKCKEMGISVSIIEPQKSEKMPISSSRIRNIISSDGDMQLTERLLGRPYMIEGIVFEGDKIGRKISTPTANLNNIKQIIPKKGVYAGYISSPQQYTDHISQLSRNAVKAVFNIGNRPTVEKSEQMRVEGHGIDTNWGLGELYNKKLRFHFCKRIRDEKKFSSLDALQKQIKLDIESANEVFSKNSKQTT